MAKAHKRGKAETTTAQKAKFLAALADGQTVTEACKIAVVGRNTVYHIREKDKAFAEAWEDAYAAGTEALEAVARQRAVDPKKGSDILLMFLMKKRDPSYRESFKHEHGGPGGGPMVVEIVRFTEKDGA